MAFISVKFHYCFRHVVLGIFFPHFYFFGINGFLNIFVNHILQDAALFWSQQPLTAREYASSTIIPACAAVVETSNSAKDLIEKEVSTFCRSPDNSLYMLPSSPQVYNASTDNLFFTCLLMIGTMFEFLVFDRWSCLSNMVCFWIFHRYFLLFKVLSSFKFKNKEHE